MIAQAANIIEFGWIEFYRCADGGVPVREAGEENSNTSQQSRAAGGVHDRRRARVRPRNGLR